MNHLEGTKTFARIASVSSSSSVYSHEIDTYGAEYASIDVVVSNFASAASSYASTLKVQQSDTSGSGQTDLTGFTVTAGPGRTTGNGLNGAVCRFNVDLRGKKRYLTVVYSPPGSAFVNVATVARLGKMQDMPTTAASAGVDNFVSG